MFRDFVGWVAAHLKEEDLAAVDIGCSGGIDPDWRAFGDRLRVLAFDASAEECERLAAAEAHPKIEYVPGFVGLPADHPWMLRRRNAAPPRTTPFSRFSAGRVVERDRERLRAAPIEEKLRYNEWNLTRLADPQAPVVAPDVLQARGWTSLDLLKIDVDGPDFDILQSFDRALGELGVLGARLEVFLCGGVEETENVFHNTDRFMRAHGFELVGFDSRVYSMRALPARFATTGPAQTRTGRTYQADAFYARDPAGQANGAGRDLLPAAAMRPEKLAKLAALYALWNQPDSAAEILLAFRRELVPLLDVDRGLDLLAAQVQARSPVDTQGRPDPAPLTYKEYMAAFEAGDPAFYPPPWSPVTLGRKIAAVVRAWRDPNNVLYPVENGPPRPRRPV